MSLRPCAEPGCPELTEYTHCITHRTTQPERKAAGLTGARGSTRRWRKLRARVIARDHHHCTRCLTTTQLHVHHKDGNAMNDNMTNLQTLCVDCHRAEERSRTLGGVV